MKLSSPRDIDIILGKGGTGRYHPGNILLRQQLTPMKIYYQTMEGHAMRSVLVDIILQRIVASGRHFYKKDEESPHKKFRIVGLDEKFPDGHLMIRNKILNLLRAKITSTTLAAAADIASGNFKMREREEQLLQNRQLQQVLQKLQQPNQQQLLEDESTARESAFDESTATLPNQCESAFDESTATLPNQCTNTTSRVQNASIIPPREIFVKLR